MLAEPEERVYLDERRHGIVLLRPLSRAGAIAAVGAVGLVIGWPASVPGAILLVVAAGVAGAPGLGWGRPPPPVARGKVVVVPGPLPPPGGPGPAPQGG